MKQDSYYGMKLVNTYVDLLQLFVIVDEDRMKTNADVNVKN